MPKLENPSELPERHPKFVLCPLFKEFVKGLDLLGPFYFLFMLKKSPQVLGRKEKGKEKDEEKKET